MSANFIRRGFSASIQLEHKQGNSAGLSQWRADLRISQDPFNNVDALILALLSYLPFHGIVPGVDENEKISL